MKKLLVLSALLAGATLGLQDYSAAHGGTYRGPGDTVPPGGGGGGGGGGPGTPGPGAPSTPGPAGPSSPGPTTPGAPAGSPTAAPRPVTPSAGAGLDLTLWQFWWGFNKEPYLNLKSKIRGEGVQTGSDDFFLGHGQGANAKNTKRPNENQIQQVVVPALLEALKTERQNDIVTGCLIALAKIGDKRTEGGESQFELEFKKFLKDPTQEIAETAALALGILANDSSIETLVALMQDDPKSHEWVGGTEVPMRTRAFAAYGLGLIGARNDCSNATRQRIAEYLMDVLDGPELSTRDVKVAAMISLGLTMVDVAPADATPPENTEGPDSHAPDAFSRQSQIAFLLDYFDESKMRANEKTRHFFVIAHAPTAMARLLRDVTKPDVDPILEAAGFKEKVAKALLEGIGDHNKREAEIVQSCTLALGLIGDCDNGTEDADKLDIAIRKELARVAKDGEEQSKRFALIALAQLGCRAGQGQDAWGGMREVTSELLDQMSKGQTPMRPWAALSLGVLGRGLADRGQIHDVNVDKALLSACAKEKSPSEVGAYCLALGLRKYKEAIPTLQEAMETKFEGSDDARGEAAVALGLIGERTSIAPIQAVIEKSKYKPDLLKQAAVGLGLLGDKEIVGKLVEMLATANGLSTQAAISSALGVIGDANSIEPLVLMLKNKEVTDSARGFAAVALGIVCDKEDYPWNSKIAVNTNYRANTLTLTGENGTGVLDIL